MPDVARNLPPKRDRKGKRQTEDRQIPTIIHALAVCGMCACIIFSKVIDINAERVMVNPELDLSSSVVPIS